MQIRKKPRTMLENIGVSQGGGHGKTLSAAGIAKKKAAADYKKDQDKAFVGMQKTKK